MKKSLKLIIMVLFIVLIFANKGFIYAETAIMSDEELDKNIEMFMKNLQKESQEIGENTEIADIKIERVGDTIRSTVDGEVAEFKYDFSKDYKFYVDSKYTKSMTAEELENAGSGNPIMGFLIISISKGNSALDSVVYLFFTLLDATLGQGSNITNMKPIEPENNNGIEYVEEILKNNAVIDTDLYKLEYVKISETSDEVVLRTNLIMKPDADYSVVKGAADIFRQDDNNTNSNNSSGGSGKELPQAGIDITLLNTLKISIIISGIVMTLLFIKLLRTRECRNEK